MSSSYSAVESQLLVPQPALTKSERCIKNTCTEHNSFCPCCINDYNAKAVSQRDRYEHSSRNGFLLYRLDSRKPHTIFNEGMSAYQFIRCFADCSDCSSCSPYLLYCLCYPVLLLEDVFCFSNHDSEERCPNHKYIGLVLGCNSIQAPFNSNWSKLALTKNWSNAKVISRSFWWYNRSTKYYTFLLDMKSYFDFQRFSDDNPRAKKIPGFPVEGGDVGEAFPADSQKIDNQQIIASLDPFEYKDEIKVTFNENYFRYGEVIRDFQGLENNTITVYEDEFEQFINKLAHILGLNIIPEYQRQSQPSRQFMY